MVDRRAVAFPPGDIWTLFLRGGRSLYDLMESYPDSLIADSHGAINQLFYCDPLRTDTVLYLIELTVELDGVNSTSKCTT